MVTIKTVAQRAGVSPTTASYALNNRPGVKPETVKKVLQAAKELNYIPNSLAKSFRNGKSNTIALFTCENLDDYSIFSLELMGVILEARKLNYDVLVKSLPHDSLLEAEELIQVVEGRRADGILLLGNGFEESIGYLVKRDIKMVLLSSHSKYDINVVNVDGEKWIYNMTEYLIQKGYRDIVYMTYALETIEELNRERGFKKALSKYRLSYKNKIIECGYESKKVFEAVLDLINNKSCPQAIVCWNDMLALQVINVLKELGKNVPDDVAVSGFDDIIQDLYYTPNLTTVRQPFTDKGRCAMKLLADIIDEKIKGPVKLFVECSLVIRESA